jgi:hypothetical protein
MTTDSGPVFSSGEVPCARHPNTSTRLRCSRCGTPICPLCAVRTPVGLRCPDCAGVRGLPTYPTDRTSLATAAGVAMIVGFIFAIAFAWYPEWNFYLSLALGFGVAETMARAAHEKRGADLQAVGILIALAAMALGRAILAWRFDLSWEQVQAFTPGVEELLRMSITPDGLFAAMTILIPWYRFR